MMKEYKGCLLEGRDDFVIEEVSKSMTLFLFNPKYFEVVKDDAEELEKLLRIETNAAVSMNLSGIYWGVIILVINPTLLHFRTSDMIKDAITRFLFDHRTHDDDEVDC